jgi:hypothetical protein
MKITLTVNPDFIITGRNEDSNMFYIRPKNDFEKELLNETIVVSSIEGIYSEKKIIEMMDGSNFYTHFNNSFTDVNESEGNIKSVPNGTTKDNIHSLPIIL